MTPAGLRAAALVLRLDREAVRVCGLLDAAAIPNLILKGPALKHWLYPAGDRGYGDIDLLVPESQQPAALDLLAAEGYADIAPGASGLETAEHARTLVAPEGITVDLHTRLHTTAVTGDIVWDLLSADARRLTLAGGEVRVCDLIPQLLVVVLHAAQHGATEPKPIEDLRRSGLVVTDDQLRRAAILAARTGAAESFAAGLRLNPSLAARLPDLVALPGNLLVKALAGDGHKTPGLVLLARAQSANRRRSLRILARAIWPTPGFLRIGLSTNHSQRPGWIIGARIKRAGYQITQIDGALRALWRLHRGG